MSKTKAHTFRYAFPLIQEGLEHKEIEIDAWTWTQLRPPLNTYLYNTETRDWSQYAEALYNTRNPPERRGEWHRVNAVDVPKVFRTWVLILT